MNSLVSTMTHYQAQSHSTQETRRKANHLFTQMLGSGKRQMIWRKLLGQQNKLEALSTIKKNLRQMPKHGKTVVNIPLHKIVGSEGRVHDFDKQFRPLKSHVRDRWVGIFMAVRQGKLLPPVELIQVGDEFYVRDGHHRISVAKMLGQAAIEAEIVCEFV